MESVPPLNVSSPRPFDQSEEGQSNGWGWVASPSVAASNLLNLHSPDDCLALVFTHLTSPRDWLAAACACHRWRYAANDGIRTLSLSESAIHSLPGGLACGLHRFRQLASLEVPAPCLSPGIASTLATCPHLTALHLVPLRRVLAHKFTRHDVFPLPEELGQVTQLQYLRVMSEMVAEIPDSVCHLPVLRTLHLDSCLKLKALPAEIGQLADLEELKITECRAISELPESLGSLPRLRTLILNQCTSLAKLPESLSLLASLETFEVAACIKLNQLPKGFSQLPNLLVLRLTGFETLQPIPEIAIKFHDLRVLHMGWAAAEIPFSWSLFHDLQDLSLACPLTELDDLSLLPLSRLTSLEITHSRYLTTLPSSICSLSSLTLLRLNVCSKLATLPTNIGSLARLRSLELKKCLSLSALPDSLANLLCLDSIIIKDCHSLKCLPKDFGQLGNLRSMQLVNCPVLQDLPASFGQLSSLQALEIWNCKALVGLPDTFGQLEKLKKLRMIGCSLVLALPESFGQLKSLEFLELLDLMRIETLPSTFGNLSTLQSLTLRLPGISQLPPSFGQLASLHWLVLLSMPNLSNLPETLGTLSALKQLECVSCTSLRQVPESLGQLKNLSDMDFQWIPVPSLPASLGSMSRLQSLLLTGLTNLRALPASIGQLKNLKKLKLMSLSQLSILPDSFGELTSLRILVISHVPLTALPADFTFPSLLSLTISHTKLSTLPPSFSSLTSLRMLHIAHCPTLRALPWDLGNLSSLHTLRLLSLPLRSLPDSTGSLAKLQELELQDLPICSVDFLGKMKRVRKVSIALEEIEIPYDAHTINVSIALEEMEIPYDAHTVNILKDEQFTPEFIAINPNSKIPAIVDPKGAPDGTPLKVFESGAILLYLAEKSGKFLPQDAVQRWETLSWLFFQMGGVGPMFGQFGHFFKYARDKCDHPYPTERYTNEARRLLGVLEKRLEGRDFLIDAGYTIADMATFPWVICLKKYYNGEEQLRLEEFPRVHAWTERCLARPLTAKGMDVCPFN
ncbi:unnamed protein product [Closterium sp. NIES-65]|nr:unnamed protein product [Closterium sp. NIES-65]